MKDALSKISVAGMTVVEVKGHGRQKGHRAVYRGTEYSITLLPKIMIELVIDDRLVDDCIETFFETARTGEIGDGISQSPRDREGAGERDRFAFEKTRYVPNETPKPTNHA